MAPPIKIMGGGHPERPKEKHPEVKQSPEVQIHVGGARPIEPMTSTEAGFLGLLELSELEMEIDNEGVLIRLRQPYGTAEAELYWEDPNACLFFGDTGDHCISAETLNEAVGTTRAVPIHDHNALQDWIRDVGSRIAIAILCANRPEAPKIKRQAEDLWDSLTEREQASWCRVIQRHTGLHRLELAAAAYFDNGGTRAHMSLSLISNEWCPDEATFLHEAFDDSPSVALLAVPGLNSRFQQAALGYAGAEGRGDLLAILDGPLVQWANGEMECGPYMVAPLVCMESAEPMECTLDEPEDRLGVPRDEHGFGCAFAPWILQENPASTRADERYVWAPPSGSVAGAIAASTQGSAGVQGSLMNVPVRSASDLCLSLDEEDEALLKAHGINPLVQVRGRGVCIGGDQTVAHTPEWGGIGSRRAWLHVVRSLFRGIGWVGQMEKPILTEDLIATIKAFLDHQHSLGVLDGPSASDAWSISQTKTGGIEVQIRPSGLDRLVPLIIDRVRAPDPIDNSAD